MITQLRKAQDSWLAKAIFALTALSFMSLFGVSGYLNRAAANPAVIRVNNRKISLAEFNAQVDEQIRLTNKLVGQNIDFTDEMRENLMSQMVQKNVSELIVKELASKQNIHIGDELLSALIRSQAQFYDAQGRFNPMLFQNFLSSTGWSEHKYVEALRYDMTKSILINNPVRNIKPSKTLLDLVAKAESQRRAFKYIELSAENMKIDRPITDEEIEQYYSDFGSEFVEPERRDITALDFSFEDIAANIDISEDEIKDFYNENIGRFVTPETREVLQMLFADKKQADEAIKQVKAGHDFYDVASKVAEQTREETNLGYVDKDMLIAEIADDAFDASKNAVIGPIESELGWHVIKINNIKAGSKVDDQVARKQIVAALRTEKAYEDAYQIVKEIDDRIGQGTTLEDVAQQKGLKLKTVKNLTDQDNSPYTEPAFSYNLGEISQATETDNGFVFVRVDKVVESRVQTVEEALPQIKKIWSDNEKTAIVNEVIGDIMHDLESGDSINEIAVRYKLKVASADELTRSQSFAGLTQSQMEELFNDDLNTAKQFTVGNKTVVAVAVREASPRHLTEEDMAVLNRRLGVDITGQAVAQMINSYGDKYDVRVKYRQLGLQQ